MQDAPVCPSCRWWRRLGLRSFVGRCGNKLSGLAYTNDRGCCIYYQARPAESTERAKRPLPVG
jgi:hypothetical protein